MRIISNGWIVFLAIMLPVSVTLPAHAAPKCANASEISAINMRVLQSDLMVAALACNQKESYNQFVKKFKTELVSRSDSMQHYFQRVHGGKAANQLNRFVTSLANDSSQTSLNANEADFCRAASALFSQVMAAKPAELTTIATQNVHTGRHGISACTAQMAKNE